MFQIKVPKIWSFFYIYFILVFGKEILMNENLQLFKANEVLQFKYITVPKELFVLFTYSICCLSVPLYKYPILYLLDDEKTVINDENAIVAMAVTFFDNVTLVRLKQSLNKPFEM